MSSLYDDFTATNYTVLVHLNESQILTITVSNVRTGTEWKQEFAQTHFKTIPISKVTKILRDAIQPTDIANRCKIISDEHWCYITIDGGAVLPSFSLPNTDQIHTEQTSFAPTYVNTTTRHYVGNQKQSHEYVALSPKLHSNQFANNIVKDTDDDSTDDEEDNLFKNMKPIEITDDTTHETAESNDILRIMAWFAHLMLILLTLGCAVLCSVYATAQLHVSRMSNLWCDDTQTLDHIRTYNRENNHPLGEEYSCNQIHGNVVDYGRLFDDQINLSYQSTMDYDTIHSIFGGIYAILCVIFVLIVLYDVGYMIWYLCTSHDTQQETEKKRKKQLQNDLGLNNGCSTLHQWYKKWFFIDMTMWVVSNLVLELLQIVIQSALLLVHGGINVMDWSNVNVMIQMPHVIIGFAVVILVNGVLISVLWFAYSLIPTKAFGFKFAFCLFLTNSIFAMIYAVHPFMIYYDQIIQLKEDSIGLLRTNTAIQFIATVFPLIWLVFLARTALKFTLYVSNKGRINETIRNPMVKIRRQSMVRRLNTADRHSERTLKLDLSPLFIKIHFEDMRQFSGDDEKIENKLKKQDCGNRICLFIFALCLLTVSVLISVSVMNDIAHSKSFCNQFNGLDAVDKYADVITEEDMAELTVYDDVCKRKLYKLFDNEYACNCQLVMFDSEMMTDDNSTICQIQYGNIMENVTAINVLNNIFLKWNMMNRFWLDQQRTTAHHVLNGCIQSTWSLSEKEMFSSPFMEVVYIRNIQIDSISSDIATYWVSLHYFAIPDTVTRGDDISLDAISSLDGLKLIHLRNISGLNSYHVAELCTLKHSLELIQIDHSDFTVLSDCFEDFNHLKYLLLNYNEINALNWNILNITSLKRLSLYASSRLPVESLNDEFISENIFGANGNLEYVFLGGNTTICANYTQFNSESAVAFVDSFNACEDGCQEECPVFNEADGYCQPWCNVNATCNFDSGDCNQ